MKNNLSDIYNKHQVWIDIVCSFGCNKETAEDITQEMYIKIHKRIKDGINIDFGNDYNYYYIFKTLKTLFLDLRRKEAKVNTLPIENMRDFLADFDCANYEEVYATIQNEFRHTLLLTL